MKQACAHARAATRPQFEVADIVRRHGAAFRRAHRMTAEQWGALAAIEHCRTPRLGGHVDVCRGCGHRRPSYNSCRNRHCPKCQALAQARWVAGRSARLLPVGYFHVVFTLPAELRHVAAYNRRRLFDMLIRCAAHALLELGRDTRRLGAELGVTTVLHTWARDLAFHPHVHCIVTGGGLSLDRQRWVPSRHTHLLPVHALGALFRGKLVDALLRAHRASQLRFAPTFDPASFERVLWRLRAKKWVVYAKRPFAGPALVLRYLGRYTHRVGLSNQRLLMVTDDAVRFVTRGNRTVSVSADEFLRRWIQHVLPKRFVKIRHWGLHAPRHATTWLRRARDLAEAAATRNEVATTDVARGHAERLATMTWRELLEALTGLNLHQCPACGGRMHRRRLARAPP